MTEPAGAGQSAKPSEVAAAAAGVGWRSESHIFFPSPLPLALPPVPLHSPFLCPFFLQMPHTWSLPCGQGSEHWPRWYAQHACLALSGPSGWRRCLFGAHRQNPGLLHQLKLQQRDDPRPAPFTTENNALTGESTALGSDRHMKRRLRVEALERNEL